MHTKKNHPMLDDLIDKKGVIRNDADLARELGVAGAIISRVRNGGTMGDSLRLTIMRKFGISLQKIDTLAPPAAKEKRNAGAEK